MVEFIRVTDRLIRAVADDMRVEDIDEVWASDRQDPHTALVRGVAASHYTTGVLINGDACAILGLSKRDTLTGAGVPWLLGTNAAMRHRREFLLQSPPVIQQMLDICPRLFNYVHCDNKSSIRWLRWLGFTIEPATPYGVGGELFHKFHMQRCDDV